MTWILNYEKKQKTDFQKGFCKLMNNAIFGKTMEDVRKRKDTKLVTTNERRNYFMSEPNYGFPKVW